jgi:hypothetical protein
MGYSFLLGSLGGSVWYFFKGWRLSPKQARLSGALTTVRMRAPTLGGNFAVWGGLFSVCDCTLTHLRGTEDAWNAILAGGVTGGILAARAGVCASIVQENLMVYGSYMPSCSRDVTRRSSCRPCCHWPKLRHRGSFACGH